MSQPLQNRDYWCFISYRHADNKQPGRQWATWLHQAIETYEVPADLVGTVNGNGDIIPERIFPVFRDEDELPADADLASPIYAALDHSKFLVVLCSPRAAQSPYVSNEITYFKKIGRSERILAAILDGEPNATDHPDKVGMAPECFPRALRFEVDAEGLVTAHRTEPIASDFRLSDGSEGWTSPGAYRHALEARRDVGQKQVGSYVEEYKQRQNLMLLKIIAGIIGVPVGVLTKRDQAYQLAQAKKRQRLLTRWLLLVGVLAVIALGAFGVALWQRQLADVRRKEAVLARTQAEDVLNFLIYDLKNELESIGRPDLASHVQKKVEDYYLLFNAKDGSNEQLRQRAIAINNEGDLLMQQGRLDDAAKLYSESLKMLLALLSKQPSSPILLNHASVTLNRVGHICVAKKQFSDAFAVLSRSLLLAEKAFQLEPHTDEWKAGIATAQSGIASLQMAQGKLNEAYKASSEALRLRRELVKDNPLDADSQEELQKSLDSIGRIYLSSNQPDKAIEIFSEHLDVARNLLAADSTNLQRRMTLSGSINYLGNAYFAKGLFDDALKSFIEGLEIQKRICKEYPSDIKAQGNLVMSLNSVGVSYAATQQNADATKCYVESLTLSRRLCELEPHNNNWKSNVLISLTRLGYIYKDQNQSDKAAKYFSESIELVKPLIQADPNNIEFIEFGCGSLDGLGYIYSEQNKFDEAKAAFAKSLKYRQSIFNNNPSNPKLYWGLYYSFYNLGELSTKSKNLPESYTWFEKARTTLAKMKKLGFLNPSDEKLIKHLQNTKKGAL